MTAKVYYKNMSDDELERLAPDDSEAAWELFNRLLDRKETLTREHPDPNAKTQPMSPVLLDD